MDTAIDARGEVKCHLFVEVLETFGQARLAVTGTSMLPSIWPGDILEVRRRSAAEIAPGQLVLCARAGGFVAHRVVQLLPEPGRTLLVTRGDRLEQPDPPVSPEELLGVVTRIRRGHRWIVPRLTVWGGVGAWLLARSDLGTAMVLRVKKQWRVISG
jgi:hypothetical protein